MDETAQAKLDSLSQAERILFSAFCKLVDQTLYAQEGKEEKLKPADMQGVFDSVAHSIDRTNLLRVTDLAMDMAADLLSEQRPEKAEQIAEAFLVKKATFLSDQLWEYGALETMAQTTKKLFEEFKDFLESQATSN